jgi:hypothetical protein
MLKAPGTKRFEVTHENQHTSLGFNFNLCRYTKAWGADVSAAADLAEAVAHLDGDLPTGTAILSLSLCKW